LLSATSTATSGAAPAIRPPCTAFSPTPPQPNTASDSPASTRAVLSTAPTPVITEQPISAALSSGIASGMGTACDAWTTV
jgi:hypothetical protein